MIKQSTVGLVKDTLRPWRDRGAIKPEEYDEVLNALRVASEGISDEEFYKTISVSKAAEILGYKERDTIEAMIKAGKLAKIVINGNTVRVYLREVVAMIKAGSAV